GSDPSTVTGPSLVDAGAGPSLETRREVGEPGTAVGEVPPHRPDVARTPGRLEARRIEPVTVRRQLPLGRWLLPAALALLLVLGWSLLRDGRTREEVPASRTVATAPQEVDREPRPTEAPAPAGSQDLMLP